MSVAQVLLWRDLVTDQLLQLLDVGEAPLLGARPDQAIVDVDLKDPTGARS